MAQNNNKLTLLVVSLFITVAISFKLKGRIVGGRDSEKSAFPYYAGLFNFETAKHICGATIISERHILTAAHCVAPFKHRTDLIGVAYGTIHLGVDRAINHVKNITFHSNFELEVMRDDIAIIETTDKIKFTKFIQPIAVAKSNFADASGIEALLCGFGLTSIVSFITKLFKKVSNANISLCNTDIKKSRASRSRGKGSTIHQSQYTLQISMHPEIQRV